MTDIENNYVCVNCGNPIKRLYKTYGESVLKLFNCQHCGKVADKYLEYDKGHLKLALLQLIIISFDECIHSQNSIDLEESDSFYEFAILSFTLIAVLGKFAFVSVTLFYLILYNKYLMKKPISLSYITKIWEAIVCSSFGYFFLLTVTIWDDFQREIHMILITVYITLSQIQALTVVTAVPKLLLGIICIFALAIDHYFSAFLKQNFHSSISKSN